MPDEARTWVTETKTACPDLPEPWIAAVMAQESGFDPDAYADDVNGGTWGLFQLNASIWQHAYGHAWSADLNGDGVWDVRDGDIHARVAGQYLCNRLDGVREIRANHPDWASSTIPVLDALIIAHNAGESRLRTYPDIPEITHRFIATVDQRAAAWSSVPTTSSGEPANGSTDHPAPAESDPLRPTGAGCLPGLGTTAGVTVPPGTPNDVAAAVTTALSYVGVTSGWDGLCDRLACRAYGYANAGYYSAAVHWQAMVQSGHAHSGDRCPPLGSFVFFNTGRVFGHVSVVVQSSPTCNPEEILVTSNGVFDAATGNHGGVYLLSLARLDAMYLGGNGYRGWSDPVCAGAPLPAGTTHPAPSGW
ncbi:transglycosylase SLT domain-containing protein [Isoptericola sp. b490]|uniref:transglycosylase SLT domain-containing protein n=1 Tax=Actinotalea lenta TaxID=3064654 RepID=UPI002712CC12|nr:transglycosylase SLT domain-containing protein [Isoptericola sp. b490]MDO8119692.1 transglycosylase SLT domain-containing protein [Isoptericola sp. b490]